MEVRSLVAWNLRRLRVARGISQDDLALSADIERAYVGHLERGGRNPTVDTLDKIAQALGVHISQLFREPASGEAAPATLRAGRKKS
jgi:transcriptional regulator with XRE-family HTH domain